MASTLYGLLVGINDYAGDVRPLTGCLNDVTRLVDFLRRRHRNSDRPPQLRILTNAEATRERVITAFREHLGQAGPEDLVLFAFSGHGSQEPAPPEFWEIEPDHKNQTLVCYDSRAGASDLADKELSFLLAEVAARGCRHIAVLLDCCHSGSGSRGDEVYRLIGPAGQRRAPDSYLFVQEGIRLAPGAPGWTPADHVLLAACESRQLAAEYLGAGERRGAFSFFLGEALERSNGLLTYRNLLARTRALITSCLFDQTPQLEVTVPGLLDLPFLGQVLDGSPRTLTLRFDQNRGQWILEAGALHGVKMVSAAETTVLALFPFDGPAPADLSRPAALGEARVTRVHPGECEVAVQGVKPPGPYRAVVIDSPADRLPIALLGDDEGVRRVRERLRPERGEGPALYLREVEPDKGPRLLLRAEQDRYSIRRPEDDRLLVQPVTAYAAADALVVRQMEQIARWYLTLDLTNKSQTLGANDVEIVVELNGVPSPGPDHRLEYRFERGKWQQPTFRLAVRNTSRRDLYCALVTLGDDWEISTALFPAGVVLIPKGGGQGWALDGRPVYGSVPRELWERGVTEFSDHVLALVSDKPFDPRPLEQPALGLPRAGERGLRSTMPRGTLQRLLIRTADRSAWSPEPEEINDWQTYRASFTVVRPLEAVEVPTSGWTPLAGTMQVAGHPNFRGRVQLLTPGQALAGAPPGPQATRDVPFLPTDDPAAVLPFHPTATRGGGPASHFLKVAAETDPRAISADAPLRLPLGASVGPNEQILAVAYDGEFWLPVGHSVRTPAGESELVIQALTVQQANQRDVERSVFGAYGAWLYKLGGKIFGYTARITRLARVDWGPIGTFNYDDDVASLRRHVQAAAKILLYVHGIFGASDTMLPCLRTGKPFADGKPLSEAYDLVLSFDYENLNTPISETARALKADLEEIGLGDGHGKRLDVVAHSMGGLVSRWLIERERGHRQVSRLVMLGTPNGGSPWPTVHSLATLGLTAALNALSVWPARVLRAVTGVLGRPDLTLEQMKAESILLGDLKASADPTVPYRLVAGNLSLSGAPGPSWQERLWSRLSLHGLYRSAIDLAVFRNQPNDIAVTVASMKHLPSWHSAERIREVGCDHMSYFEDYQSLRLLAEFLR